MSKTYRPYEPCQSFLLPPSPLDWLPAGHLARFILDTVGELDLSAIKNHYERQLRGCPPHHPAMMVSLLLYAYCVGVPSSRKIEKSTYENVAFRVIAGNTPPLKSTEGGQAPPDYSCISEFRRIHLAALSLLFVQVLRLCQKAGLVKLGNVAIDGTKVKANASKHKAMSFERMQSDEARLTAKVDELMKSAEAVDAAEDAEHGKGKRGDELPSDLQRAEGRRDRIRKLMADLKAEADQQVASEKLAAQEEKQVEAAVTEWAFVRAAHSAKKKDESDDEPPLPPTSPSPEELPLHQVPTDKTGSPTPKAQRNFTDADSRTIGERSEWL